MPSPHLTPQAKTAYENALKRIEACHEKGAKGVSLELALFGLTHLPPEIGKLTSLTWLNLNNNALTSLPPEIGSLASLEALDLANNKLTSLPPEIGQLVRLRELELYNNNLTSLPPEIGHLATLKELHLYNNNLVHLPPEIGQLKSLSWLRINNNKLASLPPEIGMLTALTWLNLDENNLTELPPEIGLLQSLQKLFLPGNKIAALPREICHIDSLEELYLHGNSGLDLSVEVMGPTWKVVREGGIKPASPQAIFDHYFARLQQGARPLNEIRLVLVGRGAAGKTSVVQRLVNNRFDPAEKETPGVAQFDWVMKDCEGEPVTAHVWDFAGQVITHSMHRYFLSYRTIYLLVLTQREDAATEDAEYWLKLIESYGGMELRAAGIDLTADNDQITADTAHLYPPVLVVLNKTNQAKVRVDQGALMERHPSILGFIETDCEDGRGVTELRTRLCRLMDEPTVKSWVRRPYPKQWWSLKEAIQKEQKNRPHISYQEWRSICQRCGVTKHEDQDAASHDLHTLGVALNYGGDDRLRDNTVLRPNWVTHHCYALIRHAVKHQGRLRREELGDVLATGEMGEADPKMHLYLMRLMERFEAAYPLGEAWPPARWLVPLGLPDNQPMGVELFRRVPTQEAIRLRYTYLSVPPGLLAQFIVRTHPLMEPGMQWASGTVLILNEARALVRAVSKSEVEITVIGGTPDTRRDLVGLCREELRWLHQQSRGFKVQEGMETVADGVRVWVNVKTLEKDELRGYGQTSVETDEGSMRVWTAEVLNEVGTRDYRISPGLRLVGKGRFFHGSVEHVKPWSAVSKRPIIFISYSHQDERHRKILELHLKVLKINGLIDHFWHDRCIQPGTDWDQKIQDELVKADVVLLLTSTASLASGYINQDELRPALERHAKGEAVVVPIILERCAWVDTFAASPPLQRLKDPNRRVPQGLPRDGKPINSFSPRADGWHQVAEGLKALLTEVKAGLK